MFHIPEGYDHVSLDGFELPETLYHVAPKRHTDDAVINGLHPKETWNTGAGHGDRWDPETEMLINSEGEEYEWRPQGIYMFLDLERAIDYAGDDDQIWEISSEKLQDLGIHIIKDPVNAHNFGYESWDDALVCPSVPASCIRPSIKVEINLDEPLLIDKAQIAKPELS